MRVRSPRTKQVLLVGRLVNAVACVVAGERRISTSCREGRGGAARVPLWNCTSLFGLSTVSITPGMIYNHPQLAAAPCADRAAPFDRHGRLRDVRHPELRPAHRSHPRRRGLPRVQDLRHAGAISISNYSRRVGFQATFLSQQGASWHRGPFRGPFSRAISGAISGLISGYFWHIVGSLSVNTTTER